MARKNIKKLIKKCEFLHDLKTLSEGDRCEFLNSCHDNHIDTVGEACQNLLKSKPLMAKKKRQIAVLKKELEELANPRESITVKRQILNQKGSGIFSILAATVLPLLSTLIAKR